MGHSHPHPGPGPRASERRRLLAVFLLTFATMIAEFVGGWLTRSIALLGDALHMLSHLLSVGLSYLAVVFAARPAPPDKTWRYWRIEILAGLVNGLALLPVAGFVLHEALRRFADPVEIRAGGTLAVGAVGLVVNVACAALLHPHSKDDLNIRGAFLHLLADGASSVGVLAAGIAVLFWGWTAADSLAAALISLLILGWCVSLVRSAAGVLLEAVPSHMRLEEIRSAMEAVTGVAGIHDLHVWTITSRMYALTAHVRLAEDLPVSRAGELGRRLQDLLDERWEINHVTLQFEALREEECRPRHEPAAEAAET